MPSTNQPAPGRTPKVRRVPVAMPRTESAAGGWLRNMRVSGFSVMMLAIIVLFVVVLAPSLRTLIQQQQQISVKEQQVASQRADVAGKKKDVARWDDPAYIEAQARDRLLYVYPGEYSYLVMGDSGSSTTTTKQRGTATTSISSTIQTPKVDWVQAMLSSVLTSGLSDDSAAKLVAPEITSGTGK